MKFFVSSLIALAVISPPFHSGRVGIAFQNPGPAPAIVANGVISTADDEFGATFAPDGQTCFFCKKSPSTISSSVIVICYSRLINGKWTAPQIAPFSGHARDFNPSISPDGNTLYFISDRTSDTKKTKDTDIWAVHKRGNGWSEPQNLGEPVNSPGWELGCSVSKDGTLYFSSTTNTGNADLYFSKWARGKFQPPDTLGVAVNSANSETDPYISPDQSYLLFTADGRPDALGSEGASGSYPRPDIYISFYKDGKWTAARNLGGPVNSAAEESTPFVSADGKTLYFTSERNFITVPMKEKLTYSFLEEHLHNTGNGLGDIYQLPMNDILSKLN